MFIENVYIIIFKTEFYSPMNTNIALLTIYDYIYCKLKKNEAYGLVGLKMNMDE